MLDFLFGGLESETPVAWVFVHLKPESGSGFSKSLLPYPDSVIVCLQRLFFLFFFLVRYFIQHCFICRPSDSDGCWDRTQDRCNWYILTVRRSIRKARSHPFATLPPFRAVFFGISKLLLLRCCMTRTSDIAAARALYIRMSTLGLQVLFLAHFPNFPNIWLLALGR